jgi:hypothetical protein
MRTLVLVIVAVAAAMLGAVDDAQAHGRGYRVYPSIGFGIGYGYYPPYRYYYPGYLGLQVWPRQRVRRVRASEQGETKLRQLYVYPAAGQSEQQLADDRYACHTWSVDQTGFDPTLGAGNADQADAYARAMTACLEARDYVVR